MPWPHKTYFKMISSFGLPTLELLSKINEHAEGRVRLMKSCFANADKARARARDWRCSKPGLGPGLGLRIGDGASSGPRLRLWSPGRESVTFFHYLLQRALLFLRQMALLGFFLPPSAAAWFEPMSVELYQTGTSEGCSTDWATAPQRVVVS